MKVDILEHEIFGDLNPKNLETYLSSKDWNLFRRVDGEVSLWDNQQDASGKKYRIWLPSDHSLGDFAQSMNRVIKTLAEFEDRSQLELLEDFDTIVTGDVIRMRTQDIFNRAACTLPLDDGMQLVRRARDLMNASACSAVDKKPVHPSRKPAVVSKYIKNLRLGQTERGSYIVKLISPIFPDDPEQPELPNMQMFARQAVETLMKGSKTLLSIVKDIDKRGKFEFAPFEEAVACGVSANLCEALAETVSENQYQQLDISVSWSYVLAPIQQDIPERVSFSPEVIPHIAKAASIFREKNPEEFYLQGYATALKRDSRGGEGTVTVVCTIDGKERQIRMNLSENNYNNAIEAHKEGIRLTCNGELKKKGRMFWLDNPSNLRLLPEEE